jgi:muramoyltetrapeptide carboxypeptidase LdcA involved in peptidoglycan recycling
VTNEKQSSLVEEEMSRMSLNEESRVSQMEEFNTLKESKIVENVQGGYNSNLKVITKTCVKIWTCTCNRLTKSSKWKSKGDKF